jgi:effector-binding domain-containing protein/uncharacterized protein YndB with AHSA1/START domain
MKILKIFLAIILLLVVSFFVLGWLAPKDYKVERNVNIKVPIEIVWENISNLESIDQWSPWNDLDTNMVKVFEGIYGNVGSKMLWEGNEDAGKGKMILINIVENEKVECDVIFEKPWKSESHTIYTIIQKDSLINVKWTFIGRNEFPANVFSFFMNMDEMLGKDFEKGLKKLNENCIQDLEDTQIFNRYKISQIQYKGGKFLAIKKTIEMSEIGEFFNQASGVVKKAIKTNNLQITGAVTGFYYSWDEATQLSTTVYGVPIKYKSSFQPSDILEIFDIKPHKALQIKYYGPSDKSGKAHYAMENYIIENQFNLVYPIIEEYVVDPKQEPDTSKWLTKIIYLID